MTKLSTIINISNNEKALDKANSIIGEQLQIETLYNNTSLEKWKEIKNIITDLELADEINTFANEHKIKIYKASGIDGVVGLLSINTPDYEGQDIAGKQLKQDGNNPHTFGRPVQGIAVKIVSKENNSETLEANKEGKILVKGPLVMQPTHNSPFNWVDVNLNGYLTPEGYLQIIE
jgi:acyl-CoA synthetase (AMP-forming)/AMP-acid ligase II